MARKTKLILAAIFGFILFRAFGGPEYTTKILDPIGYWTEKSQKSQDMINFLYNEYRSCRLELEKIRRNQEIILKQSVLSGNTIQEARDSFLTEWKVMKDTCSSIRELLTAEEETLHHANQELDEVQRSRTKP